MTRIPSVAKIPGIAIPSIGQQTYGSQQPKIRAHLDQSLVELAGGAWQAYPLSLTSIGMPHILEVMFPSDLPQTLQMSIVEPNQSGEVTPISVDTGIDVPRPAARRRGEMRKHKILLAADQVPASAAGQSPGRRAGILRKNSSPCRAARTRSGSHHSAAPPRLFAASLDRPLICETFSAPEALMKPPAAAAGTG